MTIMQAALWAIGAVVLWAAVGQAHTAGITSTKSRERAARYTWNSRLFTLAGGTLMTLAGVL